MKVVAVYNIKGGVGKTATAVNLAWLAARNARVLLWDLDPQGAATFYYRIKPKVAGGLQGLFGDDSELADAIKASDFPNLDIVPADFSYRNMDVELDHAKKPVKQLRRALKLLQDEYDYVFLDCPPSISLVSENIFNASDVLVVPLIPTTLSLRTLKQLLRFCRKHGLDDLPIMPFFSMADRRKRMHNQIITEMLGSKKGFLKTTIPYASEVEQMGEHRAPLVSYANTSIVGSYQNLWREIQARMLT